MYGQTYIHEKQFTNIHISYQTILNSVDQLDLWSWFLGYSVGIGQPICNPLRVDVHGSCFLSWGLVKTDFIVLNDFAYRGFHGMTIFDAMMYSGASFDEVCTKIYEEFIVPSNIKLNDLPGLPVTRNNDFEFILNYVPWTLNGKEVFIPEDKLFWEQYGISATNLKSDNVKSNRQIIFNSRTSPTTFNILSVTPSYTYLFDKHKKCYQPYHDKYNKWKSTCTEEDIGGWNTMNRDDLIITKSYKDWRVLKNSGYNSIWLQNEGCKIPWNNLIALQEIKTKYILFDNDEAGITASNNLADYCNQFDDSYIPVYFDEHLPKDSADLVKTYGNHALEQELANIGIN